MISIKIDLFYVKLIAVNLVYKYSTLPAFFFMKNTYE